MLTLLQLQLNELLRRLDKIENAATCEEADYIIQRTIELINDFKSTKPRLIYQVVLDSIEQCNDGVIDEVETEMAFMRHQLTTALKTVETALQIERLEVVDHKDYISFVENRALID